MKFSSKTSMKKQKKKAYIQGWGTYSNETLVCVGMTKEDIVNYLRKIKAPKRFIERFSDKTAVFDKHIGEDSDYLPRVFYDEGRTILSFPNWKNDWSHWDALVHEVVHLIHAILGHTKNMMNEDEAKAYQTDFLFKEIRRKLWKLYPK